MCREDGKGQCDRQSLTYEIECGECNNIYVGETSRSAYTRGKEQIKSRSEKEWRSALWKHCKEKHGSEIQKLKMSVTGSYSNDAMLRQICEGVWIDKVQEGSLINSWNEWKYFNMPRAIVANDGSLSTR